MYIPNRATVAEAENNSIKFTFIRVGRKVYTRRATELKQRMLFSPQPKSNLRDAQSTYF